MPRPTGFAYWLAASVASLLTHQALAAQSTAPRNSATASATPPAIAPDIYGALPWRYIGPEGNRFTSAVGIPGDPSTYYVGAASGGIYKTTDGGVNWDAIFDDQPVQSIGSLAIARSDPNVVYAGTGEAHIRSHISIGQGVFKSQDAGKTWAAMGLEKTGRIARMVVHPTNPDIVFACALGTAYGPQPERGVFRSTDGGATWTKTLFVDEKTGCSDLAMDPRNPRVLFAGMWQIEIHTWGRESGGPGSGLFMSRDGGATWKRLTGHGLPAKPVGKVALAIAPSNPDRIFALIETGDGVPWNGEATESGQLWRSDDGGENWLLINKDRDVMGRAHYYSRSVVNPDNPNELYFLTASFARSIDGGLNLTTLARAEAPGGDHHDMWIDPTNGARMIVAHDQGLSISTNRGKTWFRQRLTNAQIYHVTVDNEIPYNVLGNKQDEPSYRGPSNSRIFGGGGAASANNGIIPRGMWHSVGGGESGWATPDPTNSKLIWSTASGSGMVGGIVVRFEEDRRQFRNVEVWPQQLNGPPADLKYRFVWDAPLHISPHDHNTLYTGSQFVHRTRDGGQSWQVISPDLTLNDKSKQRSSGGLTADNIGVEYSGVVYGLAESPKTKGEIWAGTNDGQLQLTRDDGATWTNLTKNIPNLPAWGSLRSVVPSRHVAGTTYLTVDAHQENNRDPFVYRTTDYGKTWKSTTSGLPRNMVSYAKVIAEDPVRRGLLYLGTESAIFVSFDDGDNWQPLQNNLPHAPVSGIVVQEHFSDLVISTYGRGFWIMDDITPLRELTTAALEQPVNFFAPRAAYRFRPITPTSTTYDDPTVGQNPTFGASLTYFLKAPVSGGVTMTIADAKGTLVRSMRGTNRAGLNRVHWDLRYDPSSEFRLQTSPMYAPHIVTGPEGRVAPGTSTLSILAPPGMYTVTLRAGGTEKSQKVEVRKDPNSGGTEGDIAAQTTALLALRTQLNSAADAVRRVESVRVQLDAVARTVDDAAIRKAMGDIGTQLTDAEMSLVDLRQTGEGQDGVRFGSKLVSKMGYLANGIASGDFKPTDQHEEVRTILGDELRRSLQRIDALLGAELERLNALLRTRSIPIIVAPTPRPIGM